MEEVVVDEAELAVAWAELAEDYAEVWAWESTDERARQMEEDLTGRVVGVSEVTVVGPSGAVVDRVTEEDQDEQGAAVAGSGDVGERAGVA